MKIVGVVPAKSSSTRLENKNNLVIGDNPLYINACYNLSKSISKKDIYVDTDSEEMLSLAIQHGFSGFLRPENLANNSCCGNCLMSWELSNLNCDIVVQHLPTMPFLSKSTLESAIGMVKEGFDSVLACYSDCHYEWTEDLKSKYDIRNIPNSFNLDKKFIEGMGLYCLKKESFLSHKLRVCGKIGIVNLNHWERVDINYFEDYNFAKKIFKSFEG